MILANEHHRCLYTKERTKLARRHPIYTLMLQITHINNQSLRSMYFAGSNLSFIIRRINEANVSYLTPERI